MASKDRDRRLVEHHHPPRHRPALRANDYAGGINAAVDDLITQLRLPDDQARKVAAQAKDQVAREDQPQFDSGTVVFLVIFVLFFLMPLLRVLRGGGRRHGGGVWIFRAAASAAAAGAVATTGVAVAADFPAAAAARAVAAPRAAGKRPRAVQAKRPAMSASHFRSA
jgi:uncharacterized membrane protein YgcG